MVSDSIALGDLPQAKQGGLSNRRWSAEAAQMSGRRTERSGMGRKDEEEGWRSL